MTINTNFCGGNAIIRSVADDTVVFSPDLRDTEGDWFYWAFEVKGAAGKTVSFVMEPGYVGYFGAAVSHDLYHWNWSDTAAAANSFTYTFGENENDVFFAHDMLYHPSRFHKFAELRGIKVKHLCDDNKGTPIPYAVIGEGKRNIILTARHHACEATGDYIMEGIIEEYLKNPIPDTRITAIPFIDADGVVAGDQGKNRRPHDHNRDYLDTIYNGVRAVKEIAGKGDVLAVLDLHSPWHISGRNDKIFCVRNSEKKLDDMRLFGRCFEESISPDAMKYSTKNDIDPGVEWNIGKERTSCGTFCRDIPGVELAFTLETTYFGEPGNVVSQEKLVATGRCFLEGFRKFLIRKGMEKTI